MAPYLKPRRDPASRCGACDIDSIPPATMTSNSPARISCAASAMASSPDRQTLLTDKAGTVIGMPGGHRRLPGRDLTLARLQHLAHDHVLDAIGGHARPLQRRLDGKPAELGTAEPAQRAEQPADRGSGPANDYRFAHS